MYTGYIVIMSFFSVLISPQIVSPSCGLCSLFLSADALVNPALWFLPAVTWETPGARCNPCAPFCTYRLSPLLLV